MNAYERLTNARMRESFPIAGMNETTLDYLLAYYASKKASIRRRCVSCPASSPAEASARA